MCCMLLLLLINYIYTSILHDFYFRSEIGGVSASGISLPLIEGSVKGIARSTHTHSSKLDPNYYEVLVCTGISEHGTQNPESYTVG